MEDIDKLIKDNSALKDEIICLLYEKLEEKDKKIKELEKKLSKQKNEEPPRVVDLSPFYRSSFYSNNLNLACQRGI